MSLRRARNQQRDESMDQHSAPLAHKKIEVSPADGYAPAAGTKADARESVRSQLLNIFLQNVADAINANCSINEIGRTELRLDSGEVFLVHETGVTRLK
jgi:hypothetical protein